MRPLAVIIGIGSLAVLVHASDKLAMEDRVELTRGLSAEYANAKVLLPRSKKPLEFDASKGTYDKKEWTAIAHESGPAARVGDTVQVTKIDLDDDRITMQINGGFKGGKKWYSGIQLGGGMGGGNNTVPISQGDANSPGGTSIVVLFHKSLEGMKAAEVKKLLAPVLDFDRHSVTEVYSETLPPEVQQAIKDKHVVVGMDREQVKMALGVPASKERKTTEDGVDIEDWTYGKAPGKFTFVTFSGDKVIKVKEAYAGLGTEVSTNDKIK